MLLSAENHCKGSLPPPQAGGWAAGGMRRWRGPLLLAAALGICGYLVALALVDRARLGAALAQLRPATLGAVLGLSLLNYALRFLRWHGYTRTLGASVPLGRHLLYYLAGFAFTVTPGKSGEAVRALYLRPHGLAYTQSLAVLLVERLLDILAVSLLALLWLLHDRSAGLLAALAVLALLGGAYWLAQPAAQRGLQRAAERRSGQLARGLSFLAHSAGDAARLLHPARLASGLALGLAAWAAEGYGLYLIASALGIPLDPAGAIGAYSLAVLAGAASINPGGLGGAEAAMTALLVHGGAQAATALAATLVCRLATLWFAVLLGVASLLWLELSGAGLKPGHLGQGTPAP